VVQADPNAETDRFTHGGKAPLMCAAERGRADVLEVLLEAGAEVDAQSSHVTTALIEGARRGGRNTVRVLVRAALALMLALTLLVFREKKLRIMHVLATAAVLFFSPPAAYIPVAWFLNAVIR
jgi:ankyrin repeat protein